ncbi:MAG: MvaI/BcnI family restriction endonuclease [Bacillota bacterium]|nr:MvaI/BcnI family restriction endonuclease [Bacillota bacterium]
MGRSKMKNTLDLKKPIETLDEFKTAFRQIKALGPIETHRDGDTGIGKTLEDLLGIKENNASRPDFGEYELKSGRVGSHALLSLFTKAPESGIKISGKRVPGNRYLYDSFGYIDEKEQRRKLNCQLSASKAINISGSSRELEIRCDSEKVSFFVDNEELSVYWTYKVLEKAFEKKFASRQVVYVKASSSFTSGKEYFNYESASLLSGFDPQKFVSLLKMGRIVIDIRISQYPNGKPHDRGTAFRIREGYQHELFKNKESLIED